MGKFVVITIKKEKFQLNLTASNGQTILASESYTAKIFYKNGIELNQIGSKKFSKLYSI